MSKKYLLWKRALRSVLFVLLLSAVGMTNALAYSFSTVSPNGQTLYYTITNATEHTVMVTHPNGNTTNYSNGSYCGNGILLL